MEETIATSPLMFLLKLAWDCRYRIPLIITIGFMALDIRMQFELNVQTRRIRRVSLPTSGSSNQDDTSDNQDAELDYTWTSADDALSNTSDSERAVSPESALNGPLDAGPSGHQYVSARISNF